LNLLDYIADDIIFDMSTITISKELKGVKDLIAVPRLSYREFLMWQKRIKSTKTYKPTLSEKKSIERARKNLSKGDSLTLSELKDGLGINN
jgi:hypothetical protein